MNKFAVVFILCIMMSVCGMGILNASPTLDGTLDTNQYTLAYSTTTGSRVGFGGGDDCSAIYYAYDANSVYFFVQAKIDGTGNGLILMIGSSATAGYSAGFNLGNTNAGNGVFSLGAGSNGNWEMDFPVNVGIEVNAFSGTTPSAGNLFYVNDVNYFLASSFATSGYIAGISANGGVVTAPGSSGVSKAIVSYNNTGNSGGASNSTGLEVALPRVGSALGTLTTGIKLQAMAIVVSQTGFFSNDGVPTNFVSSNPGNNPNFGSSGTGTNHITTSSFGSYTWNTTVGSFTISSSWSPIRNSTATDDILIFDGTVFSLSTATAVPTQSIGQLNVINNCTATFTSNGTITLSVGTTDVSNPALYVASSSQFIFGGTKSITLSLNTAYVGGTWSVGTISGDIIASQTANVSMLLTSLTTNGIVFTSGASFQDAPVGVNVGTDCFSGTTIGGILFQSGASLYLAGTKTAWTQDSVADIFQYANAFKTPTTDVNFLSGSTTYIWNPYPYTTGTLGNRTSGYLIFNSQVNTAAALQGSIGNGTIVALNDMIFKGSALAQVSTQNQGGIYVGGNFIVESGSPGFVDAELGNGYPVTFNVLGNFSCAGTFIPNTSTNVALPTYGNRLYALTGSSSQTLMLNSNVPIFSNLSVNNNGGGIVMTSNVSVLSTFYMVNGNITTGSNTLSLGTSISGWGNLKRTTGTIIGNFARYIPAGAIASDFPVGTANTFNDASVFFTGGGATTAGMLTTSFTPSNLGSNGLPLTDGTLVLDTINIAGFWTINGNATTGSSGTAGIALTTNGFTFAGLTANARIVYRTNSSSPWTLVGNAGSNSGTQIVRTGITNSTPWGDYAIAESNLPPYAGFTTTPTSGNGPLFVSWGDTTLNLPTGWGWDFGDGIGGSGAQNPTYTYPVVGAPTTYTIRLIATNSFGSGTATGTVFVTEAGPTASFSATSTSGNGPLPIQFNDGSSYPTSSAFTTWAWNFGDGQTSNSQNPSHTYALVAAPTTYSVQLVIATPFGTSTSTQSNYISVSEQKPVAAFSPSVSSGNGPLSVTFTDQSNNLNGSSTTWSWIFGDGQTSNSQSPINIYATVAAPTTYTAKLIVTTNFGMSTATTIISVTEPAPSISSLLTPLDNLTTNNHQLLFSWSSATDIAASAVNYTLQLGQDAGFVSVITTIPSISTTTYSSTSLPNGPIFWHVVATSVFGSSTSGSRQVFEFDTTDQHVVASSETVTFYLGDSTGYLPITIAFNSIGNDTVKINQFDQKAPNLPTSHYISRYWLIQRTGSGALNADMTFSYTSADFVDSGVTPDETGLVPAEDTTGLGAWVSYTSGVTVNTLNHTLSITGITGFSPWTLGGVNGDVPVELSKFEIME